MSDWTRCEYGVYACIAHRVSGFVGLVDEIWKSRVTVDSSLVDSGEWDGRDTAIRNAKGAMNRACWLRRFEKDPPMMPEEDSDDDDEDD